MDQKAIRLADLREFAGALFDGEVESDKAARILKAIPDARSPRISDIAHNMPGNPEANYKAIHRFLRWAEPQKALKRLYLEEADFVLADPTDIERLQTDARGSTGVRPTGGALRARGPQEIPGKAIELPGGPGYPQALRPQLRGRIL